MSGVEKPEGWTFDYGDRVEKVSGSSWRGKVVGVYSTDLTPEGYAVESDTETGSVQIYPVKALRIATTRGEDARLRQALEEIAAECDRLRNGTDDWFDLVEISLRARAALQGDAAHTSQEKAE